MPGQWTCKIKVRSFTNEGLMTERPCGQCFNCRLRRREAWVGRMIMETFMWPPECVTFMTLTYAEENLPENGLLKKRDLQLFWKRLRSSTQKSIRYYCAGEYGSIGHRPHYHAICWGLPMTMKESISTAWNLGFVKVNFAKPQTFRYVAKYVTKDNRPMMKHFGVDSSGDFISLTGHGKEKERWCPPFSLMSRNPGIGSRYLKKIAKSSKINIASSEMNKVAPHAFQYGKAWYPFDEYSREILKKYGGVDYERKMADYLVDDLRIRADIWKAPYGSQTAKNTR